MPVPLAARIALVTAGGAGVAALLGDWTVLVTSDSRADLVVRPVLVGALLVTLPAVLVRRRLLAAHQGALAAATLVGLLAGYLVNPYAWTGRALVAEGIVGRGVEASALDLLLWLALGAGAALAQTRHAAGRDQALGYRD
ncbi:hypothetical protein [Cellulomonas sp. RIT-PI-Y]|uniref:hypothetical protein n=1 Tax=Cellulomonas sp. RIT-PI-Y TaxID=3035297 RepID=UPI0021DB3D11|nr:hypothetical protein [Cellulomonas sp. RIT-PI-Y]